MRLKESIEEWRSSPTAKCHVIKAWHVCKPQYESHEVSSHLELWRILHICFPTPYNSFRKGGKKEKCLCDKKKFISVPQFSFICIHCYLAIGVDTDSFALKNNMFLSSCKSLYSCGSSIGLDLVVINYFQITVIITFQEVVLYMFKCF